MARIERKTRRRRSKANVRAYRLRKRGAGSRRLELYLPRADYDTLRAMVRPGESVGAAVSRLLTCNRESAQKG
jgi:hypothetical protein